MEKKVVLVIEDVEEFRWMLCTELTKHGYAVIEADDGFGGLASLSTGSVPDLIISDVHMPGMDGLEFLKTLRKNPYFASVPVLLCSHDLRYSDLPIALGDVRTTGKDLPTILKYVERTNWKN